MGWTAVAIEALSRGETITVKPHGNSMTPRIHSGDAVTLRPLEPDEPRKGDAVLAKVRGHVYLHLVTAIDGERYQISNNHHHVNGWTNRASIYGKADR